MSHTPCEGRAASSPERCARDSAGSRVPPAAGPRAAAGADTVQAQHPRVGSREPPHLWAPAQPHTPPRLGDPAPCRSPVCHLMLQEYIMSPVLHFHSYVV